jgi:hypothetical protein
LRAWLRLTPPIRVSQVSRVEPGEPRRFKLARAGESGVSQRVSTARAAQPDSLHALCGFSMCGDVEFDLLSQYDGVLPRLIWSSTYLVFLSRPVIRNAPDPRQCVSE